MAMSTRVASAGAGGWLGSPSLGKGGMTCDDCIFLTASMFTLVDRFFWRVCSDVLDNLSLSALRAIWLQQSDFNLYLNSIYFCMCLYEGGQDNVLMYLFHTFHTLTPQLFQVICCLEDMHNFLAERGKVAGRCEYI